VVAENGFNVVVGENNKDKNRFVDLKELYEKANELAILGKKSFEEVVFMGISKSKTEQNQVNLIVVSSIKDPKIMYDLICSIKASMERVHGIAEEGEEWKQGIKPDN